ncbi:MAG: alpha/beta hydrolase [Pseudobdellovibrionaceae bacterium]
MKNFLARKKVWLGLSLSIGVICSAVQGQANDSAEDARRYIRSAKTPIVNFHQILRKVAIRDNVNVDVHVQVIAKLKCWGRGKTLLAVHGLGHTAATYENLAKELLEKNKKCDDVTRIVALDLPGHGRSTGPDGQIRYGDMGLQDYATALNNSIDRLRRQDLGPNLLLAHSMGGVVTQLAQKQLLEQRKSLAQKGIREVFLLASSMPLPLAWQFADSGAAAQTAANFIVQDAVLGTYLQVPTPFWLGLFFTNFSQQFVAGTPTPAEVEARKYISTEPFFAGADLLRIPGFNTPQIPAGIFAKKNGSRFTMISAEQDVTVQVSEQKELYKHLTGDNTLKSFNLITGDQAIHDIYITNPAALAPLLH